MPFLVLVRRAFVNAGGTARFNPQISRQISWVRVHRKRIEGYFAAGATFREEKRSIQSAGHRLYHLNRHFDCTVSCKGPEQKALAGCHYYALQVPRTRMGCGTNSP